MIEHTAINKTSKQKLESFSVSLDLLVNLKYKYTVETFEDPLYQYSYYFKINGLIVGIMKINDISDINYYGLGNFSLSYLSTISLLNQDLSDLHLFMNDLSLYMDSKQELIELFGKKNIDFFHIKGIGYNMLLYFINLCKKKQLESCRIVGYSQNSYGFYDKTLSKFEDNGLIFSYDYDRNLPDIIIKL